MPRPKRVVQQALTMREEIHKQGVITMLTSAAESPIAAGVDGELALASQFVGWLKSSQKDTFVSLVNEFAMAQVEELRGE